MKGTAHQSGRMRKPERKFILFHAVRATEATFFDENSRDNCAQPFIALRRRCQELGYTLDVTKEQPLDECEWLIFWDVDSLGPMGGLEWLVHTAKRLIRRRPFRNLYREALASARRPRMALLVAEPPSISRKNEKTDVHAAMDVVLTWNESWLTQGGKYVRTILPVTSEFPKPDIVEFHRKKLLVDISANKTSSYDGELYSTRREAIRYFEQRFPDDFDLFGVGWNTKRGWRRGMAGADDKHHYTSYRGPVAHKWDIMPAYRFAICYENAALPDYVSQRVFDVLRCNCVPIYWGATNIGDYIDPGAFVDRRRFSSNQELGDYLAGVGPIEYQAMIEAGQRYMKTDRFLQFLAEAWCENLLSALGLGKPSESMSPSQQAR